MKFYLLIILLVLEFIALAQSKKEQIENLNYQIDSLNQVVLNEKKLNTNSTFEISQLNAELTRLNASISSLNAVISEQIGPYKTVQIGTQVWMTKNRDVATFRNGDPIPEAKTKEEWKKAGNTMQPAWCYYNYDPANGAKYGKLYNWYAVNDKRGLAPVGYHIPSDAEWSQLIDYLGGEVVAGAKMKGGKLGYYANNESGFSGLPGGFCYLNGEFYGDGERCVWWSSTEYEDYSKDDTNSAWNRNTNFATEVVFRSQHSKESGFSVRCLKD
jgi:uncharacterized protein (TIGR02145 family)